MGANTIQVPLLCQKCKRRDSNTRIVSETPDNVRLVNKTTHKSLPLLVQLFFLLCSVWMVCVVVGGRPVPGSHPSSRQSDGELTQRSRSPAGCAVPLPTTGAATSPANIVSRIYYKTLCVSSKHTSQRKQKPCKYDTLFLHSSFPFQFEIIII